MERSQFDWLSDLLAQSADKVVMVFSHHTSDSMGNPLVATGADLELRVTGGTVLDELLSHHQVVAWFNGHTHTNKITPRLRADGGGLWEITTASHIDWPQQARIVEVADNTDGTLSIFTTMVDHAGPASNGGSLSGTLALSALARELSANDPQERSSGKTGALADRNVVVVFSAGNAGSGEGTITGNFKKAPWVVTVAAGDKQGHLAEFSSRGDAGNGGTVTIDGESYTWVDRPTITAPGVDIYSVRASTADPTFHSGIDAEAEEIGANNALYYTKLSGTSMAAPHISGVVALMLDANPGLHWSEVKQLLQETATNIPGREPWEAGAGYVNAYAAVQAAMGAPPRWVSGTRCCWPPARPPRSSPTTSSTTTSPSRTSRVCSARTGRRRSPRRPRTAKPRTSC